MTRSIAAFVLLFALAPLARAADKPPELFDIVLDPPDHVGDEYRTSAVGSTDYKSEMTRNGTRTESDVQLSIQFDGVMTVAELSKTKFASKLSIKVDRCVASVNGQPCAVAKRGDVVTCVWDVDRKTTGFRINDVAAAEEANALLGILFSVNEPGGSTGDDRCGSKEKRKAGDTWKLNADVALKWYADRGMVVRPEDLSGGTTLVEHTDGKPGPTLTYKSEEQLRSWVAKLPPDSPTVSEPGSLSTITTFVVPTTLPWKSVKVDQSVNMITRQKSRADGGMSFRAKTTMNSSSSRTMELLEKKSAEKKPD